MFGEPRHGVGLGRRTDADRGGDARRGDEIADPEKPVARRDDGRDTHRLCKLSIERLVRLTVAARAKEVAAEAQVDRGRCCICEESVHSLQALPRHRR